MNVSRALSVIIIAAMTAISVYGWMAIPEGAVIARHWDINGEPNGFSPREHILIGMPLAAIAITTLFMLAPALEPRKANASQNTALLIVSWLGSLGLLLAVHGAIVFSAVDGRTTLPLPQAMLFASCAMVALIGNFTAKSRSNFFLGVRTPWTLSSEHAWSVANRAAGWMFVVTAAGAIIASLIADTQTGFKILIAGIIASALVSAAISYFAWRSDPNRVS